MIERVEEKEILADELGLKGLTQYIYEQKRDHEREIENKSAIKVLTEMKFKVISEKELKDMLCKKRIWYPSDKAEQLTGSLVTMFMAFFGFTCAHFAPGNTSHYIELSLFFTTCFFGILSLMLCFNKPDLKVQRLYEWKNNIPYGALLAVKEAREKGIGNFYIYYPAKLNKRYNTDPAITGFYNGVQVLVFAWDDDKVYE